MFTEDEIIGTSGTGKDSDEVQPIADAHKAEADDTEGHLLVGGETAQHPDGDEPNAVFRAI